MRIAVTTLAFCVAALLALGMVMLYSSSMTQAGGHYLMMQLVWCALGLGLCVTAGYLDYRWLKKIAWPLFILTILLLALVLVPMPHGITRRTNGAWRWFNFGGVRFQPSELAKLALIIMLAWYGERFQRHMSTWKRGIILPGIIVAAVVGLVFIEPDRGSTVLLAAVAGIMLLMAGVRWAHIIPIVAVGVIAFGISILHDPMRMKRIMSWLDIEQHKSNAGYQAYQAKLALGAGGWSGLGLGNGRQKLGFVPEHHTDFIYSIIGEELGVIATLGVLMAFVVLIVCGTYIAAYARDKFGQLLGVGITFLIGFQAFINIGVVTSVLPNKGLPLPFISYGGSNLLAMLTCVGLLFSIARHARSPDAVPGRATESDDLPTKRRA